MKQKSIEVLCKRIMSILLVLFLGSSNFGSMIVLAEEAEENVSTQQESTFPYLYADDYVTANFKQTNNWEAGYQGDIYSINISLVCRNNATRFF